MKKYKARDREMLNLFVSLFMLWRFYDKSRECKKEVY